MTFDHLNLHPDIQRAVEEAGYSEPTQVQTLAIPEILRGMDIRASAQTGTGKTAAFLLPALHRLAKEPPKEGAGPRVLILAPTRELAMQIAAQAEKYSRHLKRTKTVCISGGLPYYPQAKNLSRPYEILIATPGRLIDFMKQGKIRFSRLELLILDEADRMLDMGFLEAVEKIISATPPSRQTLLFSATFEGAVKRLSEKFMKQPVEIAAHCKRARHEQIEQKLYYVDDLGHKNRLLDHLLEESGIDSAILFTATKRYAEELVGSLQDKGHRAGALHGDMSQRQRSRTIAQFKQGKISILVATDVAARGIDVQSISHVINFDLPRATEDYVHRIGRTGRAGAKGIALSFASGGEEKLVKKIEHFTGQPIEVAEIAGLERTRRDRAPKKPQPKRRPFGKKSFFKRKKRPAHAA